MHYPPCKNSPSCYKNNLYFSKINQKLLFSFDLSSCPQTSSPSNWSNSVPNGYLIRVSLLLYVCITTFCNFMYVVFFPIPLLLLLVLRHVEAGMTIEAYLDDSYCVHLLPNQGSGWVGEEEVGVLWRVWFLRSLWIGGSLRVVLQVAPETQPGGVVVQTPGERGWQSTKEQGIAGVGDQGNSLKHSQNQTTLTYQQIPI